MALCEDAVYCASALCLAPIVMRQGCSVYLWQASHIDDHLLLLFRGPFWCLAPGITHGRML